MLAIWKLKAQKAPRTQVGLDIGPSSVKAVRVVRAGPGELRIAQAVTAPTLHQALQELDARQVPVNIAVGGVGTVVRWATFPRMNPQELRAALSFEAEKYIPFKLDEVYLDSCMTAELASGTMEVLLAAARKELVEEQRKRVLEEGIPPSVVDLEPLALANAAEADPRFPRSGGVALAHVDERGTILDLFQDGRLRFVREVAVQKEAEASPQLLRDEWLAECRRSFDFYENQHGQRIEKLLISGEGTGAAGFLEWLQSAAGLPVERWNPALGLPGDVDPARMEKEGPGLAIAVGLAARGAGP